MFLLVPAYTGCPGQTAVKWLLLLFSAMQNALAAVSQNTWAVMETSGGMLSTVDMVVQ